MPTKNPPYIAPQAKAKTAKLKVHVAYRAVDKAQRVNEAAFKKNPTILNRIRYNEMDDKINKVADKLNNVDTTRRKIAPYRGGK